MAQPTPPKAPAPARTGLVLAGGGARAAYQVGVLKAISSLLPRRVRNPFPVISGTSAGAINGATLGIYASHFHLGVSRLAGVWENFRSHHVFRTDPLGIAGSGAHWLAAMMFGGLGRYNPHALLERAPLRELLLERLPFERIQASIDEGDLHALGITCSGYNSGQSVTFYQGAHTVTPWRRVRRIGCPAQIGVEHLMASSAIPFVFAATHIHREYFGDGSMRQIAPLSAVLHMGAEKVLVVGARNTPQQGRRVRSEDYPSVAQIGGHILNSIFLDALEADLERLDRINNTLARIPNHQLTEGGLPLRHVEVLVISPSQELDDIAAKHARRLPRSVAFLLKGIGGLNPNGSNLLSYLLFESEYTQELISLGYADTIAQKDEIFAFLNIAPALELRGSGQNESNPASTSGSQSAA